MSLLKLLGLEESKSTFVINISKIFLILALSIFLIGYFNPYYDGIDSYLYGILAIRLPNDSWDLTNELFQETGQWEFIPRGWVKTIHNTAVTNVSPGFPVVAAAAYLVGGQYGLFYLGPIIAIIFFIVIERISTKWFGRYVSLLTLLLLASNIHIIYSSLNLLSDILFSLFFILGCFYLINFLRNEKESHAILFSVFFVISAFIRLNGVVFFPVELLILGSYFSIKNLEKIKSEQKYEKKSIYFYIHSFFSPIGIKTFKVSIFIFIPWIVFFLFWFGYNDYYFGDPSSSSYYQSRSPGGIDPSYGFSFFTFDEKRFETFMGYFQTVLPFPLSNTNLPDIPDMILGKYWIGILTPVILVSVLAITFRKKEKRIEALVLTTFILAIVSFYALLFSAEVLLEKGEGTPRYTIPAFSIFSIMIGFLISKIFNFKLLNSFSYIPRITMKLSFVIFLASIVIITFYFSPQIITDQIRDETEKLKFKNPQELVARFPLDKEGLNTTSVLFTFNGKTTIEYDFIPFAPRDPSTLEESIPILKETLKNGYDIYVLKKGGTKHDKPIFRDLVEHHGIVLKDHSPSFCKLSLVENTNNTSTDKVCI